VRHTTYRYGIHKMEADLDFSSNGAGRARVHVIHQGLMFLPTNIDNSL
jgi:hypothetical protein